MNPIEWHPKPPDSNRPRVPYIFNSSEIEGYVQSTTTYFHSRTNLNFSTVVYAFHGTNLKTFLVWPILNNNKYSRRIVSLN